MLDHDNPVYMTPEAFKAIRAEAKLTQTELAALLRISDKRAVRRYEKGEREIAGPVAVVMELLQAGKIPRRMINDALRG